MAIIISKNGKNAVKIDKSNFAFEDHLQQYIYDNPESIPLYDIKEDIKLLILAREFATKSGPIDALGIDKDGEIYLVETKLYKNPDKRLVVAQVLDYGAFLWHSYNNFDEFVRVLDEKVHEKFDVGFDQKIQDFYALDEEEFSILIENFKRNLNEGKFKFVVLMDHLHDQLRDLITYINENSRFDIFAAEIEYYKYEDYEIMIPKLFGAEVKKDIGVSSSTSARRKWDEKSFFEDAATKVNEEELNAIKKLYEFSKNNADNISWGTGLTGGSFSPKFLKMSNKSLYTVRSSGGLSLNFGGLNDDESTIKNRDRFKKGLEEKEIFSIPKNYQTHYPEYEINVWINKLDDFIKVVSKLIK